MLVAVVLLAAACGSAPSGSTAPSVPLTTVPDTTAAPTTTTPVGKHLVATATVPIVNVYDAPGQEPPTRQLAHPTAPNGTPLVFLAVGGQEGEEWLNVLLPVRPNGSTGWIRQSDVELKRHDYRMLVELGAKKLTVWKGDQVFAEEPIGVGTGQTPTPGGLFYTKELLIPVDASGQPIPDGFYGPYAYGLSGYSDVLYNFAGGEGVTGIHGTNDPSSIGRDASNGCIRMHNEAITRLATTLPIGVPVEIRA